MYAWPTTYTTLGKVENYIFFQKCILAFWLYFLAAGAPVWVPNCRSRRDLSIYFYIFYFRALGVMFKAKIHVGEKWKISKPIKNQSKIIFKPSLMVLKPNLMVLNQT